jgi:polyphenol oxidase
MSILRSPLLARAGFAHGFPERDILDVDLRAALDVATIAQVRQVHGALAVEAESAGQEGDAIVGRSRPNRTAAAAVGVRVADCVPILIADRSSGDVAAIHAGWRGIVRGIVRSALERLRGTDLLAAIGPCIGSCCFEVGEDVAEAIATAAPGVCVVAGRVGGKLLVDLRAAARAQLRALGLRDDCIEEVSGCSKHEPVRFHSFRRDGPSAGRMLAAIVTGRYAAGSEAAGPTCP